MERILDGIKSNSFPFQIMKLSHKELKKLTQSHAASKCPKQNLKPGLLDLTAG